MTERYEVVVAAGTLRSLEDEAICFPHQWTTAGVTVKSAFTGAHLLHLAPAGCVLNDLYREADSLGIELRGVLVRAGGGFETGSWRSTGITYTVELDTSASPDLQARLLAVVDQVAEIPRALRAGAEVDRT